MNCRSQKSGTIAVHTSQIRIQKSIGPASNNYRRFDYTKLVGIYLFLLVILKLTLSTDRFPNLNKAIKNYYRKCPT